MQRRSSLFASLVALMMIAVASAVGSGQVPESGYIPFLDASWRQQPDVSGQWEFVSRRGDLVGVLRTQTADPTGTLAWGALFKVDGNPLRIFELKYLGMDDVGVSLESRSAFATEEFAELYKQNVALNAHVAGVRVSVLRWDWEESLKAGEVATIRLPSPPVTFRFVGNLGLPIRLLLDANGTTLSATLSLEK